MKRWLTGLLLFAALFYAGICAFLLIAQNRLLYIGTVLPPHGPEVTLPPFRNAQGTQIGWLAEPAGPARGTVVFFHGNYEEAWQSAKYYGPFFTAAGWRVIFPELPGFDMRKSLSPTHDRVIADAVSILRLAAKRYPGPLWVAGNSLGAGIAAQAAPAVNPGRILLFVPWDRMSAVAQERYPFVPARLLLLLDGTDYDSCAALRNLAAKTFIIYAGQDDIIPPRHAIHLAACLGLPQNHVLALPTATHLDWYAVMTPQQWTQILR